MSHFDSVARQWDDNPERFKRSEAIARDILASIEVQKPMRALEFGAGTGILSFMLEAHFGEIVMLDSSVEMVRVMEEKVSGSGLKHLKPVFFNLEETPFPDHSFDVVYTLLVMHHVQNTDLVLQRFIDLVKPGGTIILMDLYSEDGSFHGADFDGHKGFDPELLAQRLLELGVESVSHRHCHAIERANEAGELKEYPLFMLLARR